MDVDQPRADFLPYLSITFKRGGEFFKFIVILTVHAQLDNHCRCRWNWPIECSTVTLVHVVKPVPITPEQRPDANHQTLCFHKAWII